MDEVVAYRQTVGGVVGTYYPHYNHLYSVAALTSGNAGTMGQVVERYTYHAYGKQTITDGAGNGTRTRSAVGFDRGFTGYVADNETGLLHARFRQYSPTLGRFTSRDPIKYVDGFHLYATYFIPNLLDPSGLCVNKTTGQLRGSVRFPGDCYLEKDQPKINEIDRKILELDLLIAGLVKSELTDANNDQLLSLLEQKSEWMRAKLRNLSNVARQAAIDWLDGRMDSGPAKCDQGCVDIGVTYNHVITGCRKVGSLPTMMGGGAISEVSFAYEMTRYCVCGDPSKDPPPGGYGGEYNL